MPRLSRYAAVAADDARCGLAFGLRKIDACVFATAIAELQLLGVLSETPARSAFSQDTRFLAIPSAERRVYSTPAFPVMIHERNATQTVP